MLIAATIFFFFLRMSEDDAKRLSRYAANRDIVYATTQIFAALSDATRFQILSALGVEERSVSELQEICNVTQSAISHQLRLLRDRGVVAARRDGQRMMYSIADSHVLTLLRVGLEHAAEEYLPDEKISRRSHTHSSL